jgi:hypothetical protein
MPRLGHFGPWSLLVALLAALPLMGALAQQPAQQQPAPPPNREFTVQNETDLVLQNLFVFPPNTAERGADRLGADVVQPGASFRVRLGRTRDCAFDIVAIYTDGTEELRRRVDICRTPRVVYGDPAMPTLEAEVANRSTVMLRELYVSARGPEAWGPDRLGTGVIDPNATFRLRLRTRDCVFDLRAVYGDDREEVKPRVDLCANRLQVFDRSGIPRPPARPLELVNQHLAVVQEVYVSPSTESDWGPDRLGAQTLAQGQRIGIEVEGGCEVDVRIVFPNGGAEERREIDICETPRLIFAPAWVIERAVEAAPGAAPRGAAPPAGAVTAGALRVRNAGALPIVELYAAPPGGAPGADRLGADILPVGETLDVAAPAADACLADLTAVFRDGRQVARPGVNLCTGEEIALR